MFCPNCGSSTTVIHSTPGKHARVRRRECGGCGVRFTTTEKIAPLSMKTSEKVAVLQTAEVHKLSLTA